LKNLIALSNAQPTATDEPIKNGDALYDFITYTTALII